MHSYIAFLSFASLIAFIPAVTAGFSSSSSSNVAVYWGQNSYQQSSGPLAQQRLSNYCANTEFNIIPLAFLDVIANPSLNFANAGNNCTAISGSSLFYCPQLEADIAECQSTYGKTILLSIGGATYSEGGFSSSAAAITAATNIWSIFGPYSSSSNAARPFGQATVDGFDFDFESTVSNMPAFANQLRSLMDANTATSRKQYLLSAAPQCPYPDAADGPMLNAVYFDIVWVQFYNNYCGIQSFTAGSSTQNNFNFDTWDTWAKTVSLNPHVKILLGIPGSPTAAGSGYESGSALAAVISYCKTFSSFGGVMIWDMSQVYANAGFLDGVSSDLAGGAGGQSSSSAGGQSSSAGGQSSSAGGQSSSAGGQSNSAGGQSSSAGGQSSNLGGQSSSAVSNQAVTSTTQITITITATSTSTTTVTVQEVSDGTNAAASSTTAGGQSTAVYSQLVMTTTVTVTVTVQGTLDNANEATSQSSASQSTAAQATAAVNGSQNTKSRSKGGKKTKSRAAAASASATATPSALGTLPQWAQCGGIGYTGATVCQSPFVCTYLSEWWAQCE